MQRPNNPISTNRNSPRHRVPDQTQCNLVFSRKSEKRREEPAEKHTKPQGALHSPDNPCTITGLAVTRARTSLAAVPFPLRWLQNRTYLAARRFVFPAFLTPQQNNNAKSVGECKRSLLLRRYETRFPSGTDWVCPGRPRVGFVVGTDRLSSCSWLPVVNVRNDQFSDYWVEETSKAYGVTSQTSALWGRSVVTWSNTWRVRLLFSSPK